MRPLIDGDILLWEVGSCANYKDEETGDVCIHSFEFVRELMDNKIASICKEVGATAPPTIYLTGKGNFREAIAIKKGYKANRTAEKPFHYHNLKAYLIAVYNAEVCEGYEADDGMAMAQTEALKSGVQTIICSRDKDLRQVQGWSYSWECGQQPSWGPHLVEGFGELIPTYYPEGHKQEGRLKKLVGTGDKWFLAQLLMGDSVDNIPGLRGWGPVKVLSLLDPIPDYKQGLDLVKKAYYEEYNKDQYVRSELWDRWVKELEEQAQLVWMIRELNEDGSPKMWRL